ncbi:DUF4179 domain-containing protein [Metabacillus sp. cB07]|uniref:DUF4179 domain-containing protein n=1 Tax=Metabacillus sp. cB07 TaxID=2806989 RepID=UPI0019397DBE|nr:DUF4179 domain-containing protein [Metabacillus sp. cB07]
MKDNFENEMNQAMNKEREIPAKVRQSIEQSYDLIRVKSKKKKVSYIWKQAAAAACALFITGAVLSNEHVMAGVNEFFSFGDKGIEQAAKHGFIQENTSAAADQNIKIALSRYFSDKNKAGMSFELTFEDPSILVGAQEVTMDYRVKNGDGEYIAEFIPDTKALKGNNSHLFISDSRNPLMDKESGEIQYDVIGESHKGQIPALKGAVVEVESVNVFYGTNDMKKIDGKWELAAADSNMLKENFSVQYVMKDGTSAINVSKAETNPTSLNLTFSLEGVYEDENLFAHRMKMIDEDGNEYKADSGFSMDRQTNKTIISTNFPVTSYNQSTKLKLIIEGIGEADLTRK